MSDTINENIYMSEKDILKCNRKIYSNVQIFNEKKSFGKDATGDGKKEKEALQTYNSHKRLYARSELTNILTSMDKIPVDVGILIDRTEYKQGQRPEDVPDNKKHFLYYRKNSDGTRLYEGMDFDDLLAEQHPDGLYAVEPEEPKLGFFSWLRHKMSFLFGEPQEYKEYVREKEVVLNKKKAKIREKYGYDKMKINEELLDEEKAKRYIRTGNTAPQQPEIENTRVLAGENSDLIGEPSKKNIVQTGTGVDPKNVSLISKTKKDSTLNREEMDKNRKLDCVCKILEGAMDFKNDTYNRELRMMRDFIEDDTNRVTDEQKLQLADLVLVMATGKDKTVFRDTLRNLQNANLKDYTELGNQIDIADNVTAPLHEAAKLLKNEPKLNELLESEIERQRKKSYNNIISNKDEKIV